MFGSNSDFGWRFAFQESPVQTRGSSNNENNNNCLWKHHLQCFQVPKANIGFTTVGECLLKEALNKRARGDLMGRSEAPDQRIKHTHFSTGEPERWQLPVQGVLGE